MKKAKYLMTLLAVGIILTAGIGQTMAYFTTYTDAKGGIQIWIGDDTKIEEEFDNWNKRLTITNEEGEDVYVRARAYYAPADLQLEYSTVQTEGGIGSWSTAVAGKDSITDATENPQPGNEGPWYYCDTPLKAGEKANVLNILIQKIPLDVVKGDTFNVIVVYESTPVLYTNEGEPYADWTSELVLLGNESGNENTEPGDVPSGEVKPGDTPMEGTIPENTTPDNSNQNQTQGSTESTENGEGGSEQ